MPCALTAYLTHAKKTGEFRMRLIKSHDLHLTDPNYETGIYLSRIILTRNPLSLLTSWYALDQLQRYNNKLAENSILMPKIWAFHEKELVRSAYECIDLHFNPQGKKELNDWLEMKEKYCASFMEKWVSPLIGKSCNTQKVVSYDRILILIENLVNNYRQLLDSEVQSNIDHKLNIIKQSFKTKENPFSTYSTKLSNFLSENAPSFTATANRLASLNTFKWALSQ